MPNQIIDHLDHLVLTVASIPASIAFYERVLGFEPAEKEGRWSLHFGRQKINLHQADHTFDPKAAHPTPGSGDLCFIASVPLAEVQAHLAQQRIASEKGPVKQNGAQGPMTSVYLRDPDRNLIEISEYL